MEHTLDNTLPLLARTPAVLDALLRDLPEAWTLPNEGGNTWNTLDVVGHLIHAERENWLPRLKIILRSGETQTFETFDRQGHTQERQNPLPVLLDEFARVRSENLDQLRALNLGQRELELRGTHPVLGVVSLSQLLATWTAHDLTHLHQLSRILAHRYREAVGPWNRFLGVLQCAGHSA